MAADRSPAQIAEDALREVHAMFGAVLDASTATGSIYKPDEIDVHKAIDLAVKAAAWAAVSELMDILTLNGYADVRILRDRLRREYEEAERGE